jgi:hypothetical protein
VVSPFEVAVKTKRQVQCLLAMLASFHCAVLSIFADAAARFTVGLFVLWAFWLIAWVVALENP